MKTGFSRFVCPEAPLSGAHGFRVLFAVLLSVSLAMPALADYDKGVDAFKNEDYATALKIFKPLAEKGDYGAQYYIGRMLEKGLGLRADTAAAAAWFRPAPAT